MLNATGVADIIDYSFYPWGNAYYATEACGKGPYASPERLCWFTRCMDPSPFVRWLYGPRPKDCFGGTEAIVAQHGEREKHVNVLEACAVALYPAWRVYWPYAQCLEGAYDAGSEAWGECATQARLDGALIDSCAAGPKGSEAAVAQAKATPDHTGVPYVLVDGKSVDPDSLLEEVCVAYTGEKPEGCKGLAATAAATPWHLPPQEPLIRIFA